MVLNDLKLTEFNIYSIILQQPAPKTSTDSLFLLKESQFAVILG